MYSDKQEVKHGFKVLSKAAGEKMHSKEKREREASWWREVKLGFRSVMSKVTAECSVEMRSSA